MKKYIKRFAMLQKIIFTSLFIPTSIYATSIEQNNNFLVISDIHLDKASSHTMEIMPNIVDRNNDLDQGTFDKLLTKLDESLKDGTLVKPKFVILLGDIVGHIRTSVTDVAESQGIVFRSIQKLFPNTPIFYTFGNNDSLSVNYGPFKDININQRYQSPYDVAKLNGWKDGFLSTGTVCLQSNNLPCLISQNNNYGFYSAYLEHGFRLIDLNSVLFAPRRPPEMEDAALKQLGWLRNQLRDAVKANESVLISMHIPVGNNIFDHSEFWLPKEQAIFLEIIKTYQKNIVGMIASHTHAEELKVIKSAEKNVTGLYLTAALSTFHGNEPSVKAFYYSKNKDGFKLTNYETFSFSVDNSILLFNKLYDFNHFYCSNSGEELTQCLGEVTAEKMKIYFSAGNKNYPGVLDSPNDIFINIGSRM